jgi:hypothetical protein
MAKPSYNWDVKERKNKELGDPIYPSRSQSQWPEDFQLGSTS